MSTTLATFEHILAAALKATPAPLHDTPAWHALDKALAVALASERLDQIGALTLKALIEWQHSHLIAERALTQLQLDVARGTIPHGTPEA